MKTDAGDDLDINPTSSQNGVFHTCFGSEEFSKAK